MSAAAGWIGRFDVAARTRRGIVLYQNVLDLVLDESGARPLPDWVQARLSAPPHLFERIVRYDHANEPRVVRWGDVPPDRGHQEMRALLGSQPRDPADPASALRLLSLLVRDPSHRTALIVENLEHRILEPSQEAVLLRQLTRAGADGMAPGGLAVLLVSSDSRIPHDFVTSDADIALVLVSTPAFAERQAYFARLPEGTPLLQARERGVPVTADRLARLTEGYRLREIEQLARLAEIEEPGADVLGLLSAYRHGRRIDYWAEQDIDAVRRELHAQVLGQDEAIERVIDATVRAKHRVGELIDDATRRPAMILFFVGTTGVGKTLMARAICRALTGTEENLKRIDMTEYQREHADQRLIGPPPGYVGHLDGGQLTNWVLERPRSVVLIDEFEKAHQRIFDVFLQILEGARLTDGKGQTVDMSETIFIFTSNIGTAEAMGRRLDRADRGAVEAHYRLEVERFFNEQVKRPEIFNRLKQGIVVFNYIDEAVARAALESKVRQIADGIGRRSQGALQLHFDPGAPGDRQIVDELLARADYGKYGLRDVNNTLDQLVGGAVGRLLDDAPRLRAWRFRWNATEARVELVPHREPAPAAA